MFSGLGSVYRFVSSPLRLGLLLAVLGFLTWTSLSLWAGLMAHEAGVHIGAAWDTAGYYYLGVPLMALAVAIAAFHHPHQAWRWPAWLVAGHQAGVLVVGVGMQSALSLLILALIFAVLLGALFAVPATLGVMAARRMGERAY